jgi:hypothetical protein
MRDVRITLWTAFKTIHFLSNEQIGPKKLEAYLIIAQKACNNNN